MSAELVEGILSKYFEVLLLPIDPAFSVYTFNKQDNFTWFIKKKKKNTLKYYTQSALLIMATLFKYQIE